MGGNYSRPDWSRVAEDKGKRSRALRIVAPLVAAPLVALGLMSAPGCGTGDRPERPTAEMANGHSKRRPPKVRETVVEGSDAGARATKALEASPEVSETAQSPAPVELGPYRIADGLRKAAEGVGRGYDECMQHLSETTFEGTDLPMYPGAADAIAVDKIRIYSGYDRRALIPKQVIEGFSRDMPNTYDLLKIAPHTAVAIIATHYRPSAEHQETHGIEGGITKERADGLAEVFVEFSKAAFGGDALPQALDRHLAALVWNWNEEWDRLRVNPDGWGETQHMLARSNICKVCTYSARRGRGVFGEVGLKAPDPERRGEYLRDFERRYCD